MSSRILILDFGSQYTQLIARRVRELKVYCEIRPYHLPLSEIDAFKPDGIILSGSPASSFAEGAPDLDEAFFRPGRFTVPMLGICYGFQLMAKKLGGSVNKAQKREYGLAEVRIEDDRDLFCQLNGSLSVWMSHGDRVEAIPEGFGVLAQSDNSPYAAVADFARRLYAVQFHPEVAHTPQGKEILANFLFRICQCQPDWNMHSFIENSLSILREKIGNDRVILGLSGGVDSSVAALLLHKAIGKQLTCIFVDNGLLRAKEGEFIRTIYQKQMGMNVDYVDASETFLKKLTGVVDPEKKRKIIGETFIRVFETEAKRLQGVKFLAQGTLYPDVIESVSVHGPSVVIKSHHNVGGLPKDLGFELIEPFRFLFKDEVRSIGLELGLDESIVFRHPFPGPGLAVRVLGEITDERLDILRKADTIFIEEIKKAGLYKDIWQAFAVLLPISSVGVMGDERTYESTLALRAVASTDGMTADWVKLPYEVLASTSSRITNEVKGINRVVYDVSSKPPATIEWE